MKKWAAGVALWGAAALGGGMHTWAQPVCSHPEGVTPFGLMGDVNDNGQINVADALCSVMSALTALAAGPGEPNWPACVEIQPLLLDLDCDGEVTVADTQLVIWLAISGAFPASVASPPSECPGACTAGEPADHFFAKVVGGDGFSLALTSAGAVYAWGENDYGQLGSLEASVDLIPGIDCQFLGEPPEVCCQQHPWACRPGSLSPVLVPSLTGVIDIAAGEQHALAVTQSGALWAWGRNWSGALGVGHPLPLEGVYAERCEENWNQTQLSHCHSPVQVTSLSAAVSVAAGMFNSMALLGDGTVWGWGQNEQGQLGNGQSGTSAGSPVPVQAMGVGGVGVLSGIVEIAYGWNQGPSLARRQDGTLVAWGTGGQGALGNGSFQSSAVPVEVLSVGDATGISAGSGFSMALRADGTVWAWGYSEYGRLGDGSGTFGDNTAIPQPVVGPSGTGQLGGIVGVAAGWAHALAVAGDGTVWAWGMGTEGQLGLGPGTGINNPVPQAVPGITDARAVATGRMHSLALEGETVWAWGLNDGGQLGDGSVETRYAPVEVGFMLDP